MADRDPGSRRDLRRLGLATLLLVKLASLAQHPARRLGHVHRNADRTALVRDGARDGLSDPPYGIGRYFHAVAVIELLDRVHEAHIALLNQVEEVQRSPVAIFLRNRDDETHVRSDHFLARKP